MRSSESPERITSEERVKYAEEGGGAARAGPLNVAASIRAVQDDRGLHRPRERRTNVRTNERTTDLRFGTDVKGCPPGTRRPILG